MQQQCFWPAVALVLQPLARGRMHAVLMHEGARRSCMRGPSSLPTPHIHFGTFKNGCIAGLAVAEAQRRA